MRIDEHRSFVGLVRVYGLPVYLDTISGTGVAEVLEKMSKFLDGFSRWRHADSAIDKTDMRQEAYVAALEGMRSYRDDCSTQLSTFLHQHVRHRMIDLKRRVTLPCQIVDITEIVAPIQKMSPEERVDLESAMECIGKRWRHIIHRRYVDGDQIGDIARDEKMSPWGLTRALDKCLVSIKRQLAR